MKTIVIMNRWKDDFADYISLIDHFENNIIYICNSFGSKYINDREKYPHELYVLPNLVDGPEINSVIRSIIQKSNKIDYLVALSEYDMELAGIIRSRFEINGMNKEVSKNFTNKVTMKRALEQSHIRFPKFLSSLNNLNDFVEINGFPFVVKPHYGAASHGVSIIKNKDELFTFLRDTKNLDDYECEEFIDMPIVHVDGVIQDSQLVFARASRYIGTCFEYTLGKPLGSIVLDSQKDQDTLSRFAKEVVIALGLKDGVFHLEAFYDDENVIFLEVGARQGGGEVVPLMKQLFNVDLISCFFKTQIGEKIDFDHLRNDKIGGFLLIPEPEEIPCVVKKVTSMKNNVESLKIEILPTIGAVFDGNGGYYFNSGRFLFVGPADKVEKDIIKVMTNFRIKTEKL